MMVRVVFAIAVAVACTGRPGAAIGQEGVSWPAASPTPSTSAPAASSSPEAERRDLSLDLPATLGGMDTQIQVTRGEEHFPDLDPDDAAARETAEQLRALLAETGARVEDLSSGYALVSLDDLFAFTVAVRVEGVEAGTLLPAYLPILLGDLREPTTREAQLGGKDVLVVTSEGDEAESSDLYVYDAGDTIWIVLGPDDVIRATLEDLP